MVHSDKGNGKHTSLRFGPHLADRFTVRPEYLKAAEHLLRRSKSCARQSPVRKSDAWSKNEAANAGGLETPKDSTLRFGFVFLVGPAVVL
jgi:hypothetical protein